MSKCNGSSRIDSASAAKHRCIDFFAFFAAHKTAKMTKKKLTMGKGAVVSALSDRVHPSELICAKWPNPARGHRLERMTVIQKGMKIVNKKHQQVLILHHPGFKTRIGEPRELQIVEREAKVDEEGNPDLFYTPAVERGQETAQVARDDRVNLPQILVDAGNNNICLDDEWCSKVSSIPR
jgi:hypothetical protein